MKLKEFMAAMQAIESDRKLSKEIVVEALKEALAKAYRKHIEIPDALVRVDINEENGEINVYQERVVVEEVEDSELEISLKEAQKEKKDATLGSLIDEEVSIANLGRAAVVLAKNVMKQKIREAEKLAIYDEYCDKVDEMIIGIVESQEEKFCIVNIGKTLALMPKNQQIPDEVYKEGERIRVVIKEVNKETKGAQVIVSRADEVLVKRLFEKEVPEIFQGTIEIKAIARDAGERTKMAVYSHNENIDPIGACIGPRGQRVQMVINELHGEKIDIFEWSDDISELIKNALSPAVVLGVIENKERKDGLYVIVGDDQLSLAIGKKGKNAKLAVKLTNSKIDIKSESEMNELIPEWQDLAMKMREDYAIKKKQEKHEQQEELFEKARSEQAVETINDDFDIPVIVEETVVVKEQEKVKAEKSDLEKVARIAKEKSKTESLNLKEKQEYRSKFETFADASTKVEEKTKTFKKYEERRNEENSKEEKRSATFEVNKEDYELKPIYTDEELKEIEIKEQEEKANDWINDEIDFDEYDEYYDEE